ncbi:nuclease [Methylobacterium nodulans]|uniref:VRR-NUC domain protein n=1 Tax=Methylobacterium nodulans (strain LMG 21967 / CNCM I-2342 / ORS 2060) TaxID=460265 RepID=B8IRR6_METNO|nr:nuclease [Methylobacterium nodulans]ACL60616.1 VRR-NUC domain protein [Methylobacterium nodulans ORS 2060]
MTRARDEQRIQTAIVTAMHRAFDCRCVHVANGGARGKLEAVAFKAMGVWAGHPDLNVYGRSGAAPLFMIEVKERIQARERAVPADQRFWSLSDEQKPVVSELRERGIRVFVVDSPEDAVAAGGRMGLRARSEAPRSAAYAIATGL